MVPESSEVIEDKLRPMDSVRIIRPLGSLFSSTADLSICRLPGVEKECVLKLAQGSELDSVLAQEAELIRRLRAEGLSEPIKILAVGQYKGRYGFVMPFAEGDPIGGDDKGGAYLMPIKRKKEVIYLYLQFIADCWNKAHYLRIDHQAESVFWDGSRITVVDFTQDKPSRARPSRVDCRTLGGDQYGMDESYRQLNEDADRWVLTQKVIPQLAGFFQDAYGFYDRRIEGRKRSAILDVEPREILPTAVLGFYERLVAYDAQHKREMTEFGDLVSEFHRILDGLSKADCAEADNVRIQCVDTMIKYPARVESHNLVSPAKPEVNKDQLTNEEFATWDKHYRALAQQVAKINYGLDLGELQDVARTNALVAKDAEAVYVTTTKWAGNERAFLSMVKEYEAGPKIINLLDWLKLYYPRS